MPNYTLYFRNSNDQQRQIAAFECEESEALNRVHEAIHAFCEERDFRIYYTRMWNTPECSTFDVGSHTEFFHVEPPVPLMAV